MHTRRILCALLTCVAPFAAHAGFLDFDLPHLGEQRAFTTTNYTLVTQDAGTAKLLTDQVASLEGLLATLLERDARPTGKPTVIYVMRAETWHSLLDRYPGTVFLPQRFANYILVHDHQRGASLRKLICSEYTRLFLHEHFRAQYPLWFEEGLAGVMQGSTLRSKSATFENPDIYAANFPSQGVFSTDAELPSLIVIPLRMLMKVDSATKAKLEEVAFDTYTKQTWSTVYRALIADPVRRKQTLRFLEAYDAREPLESAVQTGFGISLEQLDQVLRNPERKPRDNIRIEFPAVTAHRLKEPRLVDETEGLTILARALLESPDDALAVDKLLDQAASLSPGSNVVKTLRLYRAAQARDDVTLLKELQALESAVKQMGVARAVGLALTERIRETEGPPAIRERAFTLLDQALAARPDDAEAAWAFGIVAAQLKRDLPLAEQRLRRAEELVPRSADLEMAKAYVYAAQGQRDKTMSSLDAIARFSRQPALQSWALTRLQAMRDGSSQ